MRLTQRVFLVVISACSGLLATTACAQITNVTNDQATPTPGSGHDYIQMLDEIVNPANGSVSIRIEVPVPRGRGLTLPFGLAYNSNGLVHLSPGPDGSVVWDNNQWGYLTVDGVTGYQP